MRLPEPAAPSSRLAALVVDLAAEQGSLDAVVAALDAGAWETPTPATGWTIADQVHHLWFFDRAGAVAARDPEAFATMTRAMLERGRGWERADHDGPAMPPAELLVAWRSGREELAAALAAVPAGTRLPWFGTEMGVASFATARLMECWCHGQDVRDALGLSPSVSPRLRHVVDIGVRALPHSFRVHGLDVPAETIRVEVSADGGEPWTWGEPDAAGGVVRGTALDLALVVTQRRHVEDTALEAEGSVATRWLAVAQAFAGPPGGGRRPGQFPAPAPPRDGAL